MLAPANYWKVMAGLWALTFFMALIFLANPQIDLMVAGWFFNAETERFAGDRLFWLGLREIVNTSFDLLVLILLFLWGRALYRGPLRATVPAWFYGFPLATILIGPGLIVNVIFKNNWGRARPEHVTEFGGDLTFSPPMMLVEQCSFNCSFTSGEAASLSTLGMLLALLFGRALTGRAQKWIFWGAGILAFWGCFSRIFMGRHFLSDTIFSVLFCAITLWAFWGLFGMARRRNYTLEMITEFSALWNWRTWPWPRFGK